MKVSEVASFFKREMPEWSKLDVFTPPTYRCTRHILLRGPAYGEKTLRGSLMVEASQILNWAEHHAKNCWSTDEAEQAARQFLPEWLREADAVDDTITLLSAPLRNVVASYDEKFFGFTGTCLYCPDCTAIYGKVVVKISDERVEDSYEKWTREWLCPAGHIVRREDDAFRVFR